MHLDEVYALLLRAAGADAERWRGAHISRLPTSDDVEIHAPGFRIFTVPGDVQARGYTYTQCWLEAKLATECSHRRKGAAFRAVEKSTVQVYRTIERDRQAQQGLVQSMWTLPPNAETQVEKPSPKITWYETYLFDDTPDLPTVQVIETDPRKSGTFYIEPDMTPAQTSLYCGFTAPTAFDVEAERDERAASYSGLTSKERRLIG